MVQKIMKFIKLIHAKKNWALVGAQHPRYFL